MTNWKPEPKPPTKRSTTALDDDLNTAKALAAAFKYIRDTNTAMDAGEFLAGNVACAQAFWRASIPCFDVLKPSVTSGALGDREINALVAERTARKKIAHFKRADEIRAQRRGLNVFWKTPKKESGGKDHETRIQAHPYRRSQEAR